MNKEKKKRYLVFGIILLSVVVIGLSGTYAYFVASVGGTGNTTNNQTSVTAVDLGSIYYDGVTTFTGTDLYPGQKFVQEFKIGPNSTSGTGIYEIDLEGIIPEAFGSDVTIKLYKTTDAINNNVVRTEGTLVQSGNQFYKGDIITVNGTPELVYEDILSNSSQIILEQADFDVTTLEETTYYLVYEYANNGNQDAQQGLTFSGKVTVKLGLTPPNVKYAVSVYGIEEDTYSLDNGVTTVTAGLTFGPATGASFVSDYVSKDHNGADHTGTTALGNSYRCIHDDDWETIIYWNEKDPYVYQKCQGDADHLSCTKAVPLYLNDTLLKTSYSDMSGDGSGVLHSSIVNAYRKYNREKSIYFVSNTSLYKYGATEGGWRDSAVRNTLNGVVTDNMLNITNQDNGFATAKLSQNTALISAFPSELKKAIVPKAVKSFLKSKNWTTENMVITYDKLWLFSSAELFKDSAVVSSTVRGNEGVLYSRQNALGITYSSYGKNIGYYEADKIVEYTLRTISLSLDGYIDSVLMNGEERVQYAFYSFGLAPGFVLK